MLQLGNWEEISKGRRGITGEVGGEKPESTEDRD